MPNRRRKRKNTAALRLKWLIAVLAVVLAVLLAVALPQEDTPTPSDPPSTDTDPTHSDPAPTTPPLNGWIEENGRRFYYIVGVKQTGILTVDNQLYAFDENGVLLTAPGWADIADERCYIGEDGTLLTGWLILDTQPYYLHPDGTMARGEVEINGERWFFTDTGKQFLVVNPWNYVPEGYHVTLVDLPSRYAVSGQQVDSSCYDALIAMMDACMQQGHQVCIVSSYRTQEYQQMLYNNQVNKQMAALGCTREEAEVIAATISAIPGTSEHQLGLAVDIVDYSTGDWSLEETQADLPGQQWLMENCWRYGFILRYPKDKTDSTGIIYEPWHYRYVGTELAAQLYELGLTVEEYIAQLSK